MAVRGYLGRYGADIGIVEGQPGALSVRPGPAAVNPNYLALSHDGQVVYAALRDDAGNQIGAYAVDGDGLRPLGAQPSGGNDVCHLSVDASGRYVLSAHYGHSGPGVVAVHPIAADGSVEKRCDLVEHSGSGPHERQAGAHPHMVVNDPTGAYVLVVDLGADTVFRYELVDGRLRGAGTAKVPAGAGSRHLAFHPGQPYAYVANELDSTVSVLNLSSFEVEATLSTVAPDWDAPSWPSAIRVSDDGRFCYIANRGPETIAVLSVSDDGGNLQLVDAVPCGGDTPRDLVLAGDYLYVANQRSDAVTQFTVDATGIPQPLDVPVVTPAPTSLVFADHR